MPEPQYITLEVSQLSSIIINAYNKVNGCHTGLVAEEIKKALIENNTTKDSYMVRIKHGEFEELNKPHKLPLKENSGFPLVIDNHPGYINVGPERFLDVPKPDGEHSDQRIQEQEQDLEKLNDHFERENEKK
jgi:hypothetical protein